VHLSHLVSYHRLAQRDGIGIAPIYFRLAIISGPIRDRTDVESVDPVISMIKVRVHVPKVKCMFYQIKYVNRELVL
jgi:hypothetical protein